MWNMCRSLSRTTCLAALALASGGAWAQDDKPAAIDPDADVQGDVLVGPGYRRVFETQRVPVGPDVIADFLEAGKPINIDPVTGEMIMESFRDYLPKGWLLETPRDLPAGVRVDSFGNRIVNDIAGLPAWSQRDIDALRTRIAEVRDQLATALAAGEDIIEIESALGNYMGQAIVRGINVDDILKLEDALITPHAAQSVLSYLNYYENQRHVHQGTWNYLYTPTIYPQRVIDFITRNGSTLAQVQHLSSQLPGGSEDDPEGPFCYNQSTFARGITLLTGQTDIWVGNVNSADDEFSDVSIGFPLFFFYDCQDADNNTSIRITSNGYASFFQQGGNATVGGLLINDPIPDASSPDGYVAPWWDDMLITNQGVVDRVSYKTEGATGARVFTAEWYSVSRFSGGTTEFYYYQFKLYETSGLVEFHYGLTAGFWNPDGTNDSATIGIENYDGTAGECGPNCTNTNGGTGPASNYTFSYFRPLNDNCASAIRILDGASLVGVSLGHATSDGASACGATTNNRDMWYRYIATCNGTLTVSTCGSRDRLGTGTGIDSVLSLHPACPGTAANQISCNDDFGAAGCNGLDSQLSLAMVAGDAVLIRVTHFGNTTFRYGDGTFNLNVTFAETGIQTNDLCTNAITVFNGSVRNDSLGCAENDGTVGCGGSSNNKDVWYTFQADCSGSLTVSMCGTLALGNMDPVLSFWNGCPQNGGSQLVCNDDFGGTGCSAFDSQITRSLVSGERVYIRVSHFGNSIGDGRFTMSVSYTNAAQSPPANDDCTNAIQISCNDSITGTTCGATLEAGAPAACGTSIGTPGVWYRLVGDGGTITLDTCSPDTSYDTKISVFTGACGAFTCVAGNDDVSCPTSNELVSRVSFNSTAGTTYRILVHGFGGAVGFFRLNSSTTNTNETCSTARVITAGTTYTGNLICHTADASISSCSGLNSNRDVWFRFTAPSFGTLDIDMCGTIAAGGVEGVLQVHSACPPNLGNLITCNDGVGFGTASCHPFDPRVRINVNGGSTVYIRVTNWSSQVHNGNFILNTSFRSCDSIDFNNDGLFPDTQDIVDFLRISAGGTCAPPNPPFCNTDIDINNDGLFPDTQDLEALLSIFQGGFCL